MRIRLLQAAAAVALCAPVGAQNRHAPAPFVLTNVRLSRDVEAPRRGLVIAEGRIRALLEPGEAAPEGMRLVDGEGALALPAFIDAYSTGRLEFPEREVSLDRDTSVDANVHIDMRRANRKGIRPSFSAVDALATLDEAAEDYREAGFGLVHVAPSGELLGGESAVVSWRDAALRDRVVSPSAFATAAFSASGPGYPRTLMGFHAQLRQFILDARRQELLLQRYRDGRADRRPPFDRDFEAVLPVLRRERRLLCAADSARDIRRWLRLADELGVDIAISGGAEAWKVAGVLAERGVPVLLELDWPEEVEDPDEQSDEGSQGADHPESGEAAKPDSGGEEEATSEEAADPDEADARDTSPGKYTEPLGVRRERRRRWVEARDCALRLHEAGVVFALGSGGLSPSKLLKRVRTLVEEGLPEDVALDALTVRAAELLGVAAHAGRLEVGLDADIALWTEAPFQKQAELSWLCVDGERFTFENEEETVNGAPDEGLDLSGTWVVTYEEQEGAPATLELTMDAEGAVGGTLSFTPPGGSPIRAKLTGNLSGAHFELRTELNLGGFTAEMKIAGELRGDEIDGDATWRYEGGEESNVFHGERKAANEPEELR